MRVFLRAAATVTAVAALLLGQASPAAAQTKSLSFTGTVSSNSILPDAAPSSAFSGFLTYESNVLLNPDQNPGNTAIGQYFITGMNLTIGGHNYSVHSGPAAWMRVTNMPESSPNPSTVESQFFAEDFLDYNGTGRRTRLVLASSVGNLFGSDGMPDPATFPQFSSWDFLKRLQIGEPTNVLFEGQFNSFTEGRVAAVPEPISLALLVPSLGLVPMFRRRKKAEEI